MRIGGWVLAPALACSIAHADDARRIACDADTHASVLRKAASAIDVRQRAIWLNATRLRWPEAPPQAHVVLASSATAAIVADRGKRLAGADHTITLVAATTPTPPATRERFRWFGAGPEFDVPVEAQASLAERARGQLVLLAEDADGRVLAATGIQHAAALDARYAATALEVPLGAAVGSGRARFALWAPTAQAVALCLYPDAAAPASSVHAASYDAASGVWQLELAGRLDGHYYTWLVDVHVPGTGIVRNRVTDPWSLGLNRDSQRSLVVSLADPRTEPDGWAATARPNRVAQPTDLVIYELHVRDFSAGDASVPAPLRGKYLAFALPDSKGLAHLAALADAGVTDIHLLPAYDLTTVPESGCITPAITGGPADTAQQAAIAAVRDRDCFNWGYDPWHYTVPEGSYATDAMDGFVRIREFRAMVQALHRRGLRVGMDVVYNHSFASGQAPQSVLDRIVPGYYHRLDREGRIERSTCCENTATEHAMMERLMIDSAVVWARDYRIDSFRFDLMGHQPRAAMERLQRAVDAAAGRRIHLIGEGWNFGEVRDGARFVQASQRSLQGSGIATFSDRARDAARGGGVGDHGVDLRARQGWLNGLVYAPNAYAPRDLPARALADTADLIRVGLAGTLADYRITTAAGDVLPLSALDYAGQPAGYVAEPGEVVNYVENHDNQTLFDVNALKLPDDTPSAERARVQVLGTALVAFSQGMAYLHAGQEILRSKSLDRNSYNSGDWFNRIDWTLTDNGYGAGLPPDADNAPSWPWMRPLLENPAIKPTPDDIAWTFAATLDLLRIRASSTLFRLRTAADVRARLSFPNSGPGQDPTVVVGRIDGQDYPGARFRGVLYAINVNPNTRTLAAPETRGEPWVLHPVHHAPDAADTRPREAARHDAINGTLIVPGRTAVVWVLE